MHEQVRSFHQEAAARFRADRLIGQGPAMQLARRQVKLAAASRVERVAGRPVGQRTPTPGRRHPLRPGGGKRG